MMMHLRGKHNYLLLDEKFQSEWNLHFKRLAAKKRLLQNNSDVQIIRLSNHGIRLRFRLATECFVYICIHDICNYSLYAVSSLICLVFGTVLFWLVIASVTATR